MMTPESLSREGSPTPGEGGSITLHAAPPHNVSGSVSASSVTAVVEPTGLQQQIVDLHGLQAATGGTVTLNAATVLSAATGQPISVTHAGQPFQLTGATGPGGAAPVATAAAGQTIRPLAAPQKLIVAGQALGQAPRLIVPAQLLANNGGGPTTLPPPPQGTPSNSLQSLEVKKEGSTYIQIRSTRLCMFLSRPLFV